MKRTRGTSPITKSEALEILASAVSYCQQSGLKVRYSNYDNGLALVVEGASVQVADTGTRFVVASNAADVASKAGDSCQQKR